MAKLPSQSWVGSATLKAISNVTKPPILTKGMVRQKKKIKGGQFFFFLRVFETFDIKKKKNWVGRISKFSSILTPNTNLGCQLKIKGSFFF